MQPDIPAKNCFVCSLDVHSLYLRDNLSYELVGWWQQDLVLSTVGSWIGLQGRQPQTGHKMFSS